MANGNTANKILLIGLDGGTFDIVKPFAREGLLPNLAKLMEHGSYGILESTIPPISPPGWATFMTGKNPGKHGVLQFLRFSSTLDQLKKSTSVSDEVANYSWIHGATIFDIFRQSEKKLVSINIPLTYPTPQTNGCIISCWLTPAEVKQYTYPADLANEIPGYRIHQQFRLGFPEESRHDSRLVFDDLFDLLQRRTEAALHLMKRKEWDLFMICITETDRLQHAFWRAINPEFPGYDSPELQTERNLFWTFYQRLDKAIGELIQAAGEGAIKIVVSDHGFGPPPMKRFYFNNWLIENDFFRITNREAYKRFIKKWLGSRPVRYPFSLIPKILFPGMREALNKNLFEEEIDWDHLLAWAMNLHNNWGAVYINHNGRSPGGVTRAGEDYISLREQIISGLKSLNNGNKEPALVQEIYRNEEIYRGPYAKEFPDIVFKAHPNYETGRIFGFDVFMASMISDEAPYPDGRGNHQREGMYIFSGDPFRMDHETGSYSIECILPTLLYLLGIPIPEDTDGTVVTDLIKKEYLNAHSITHQKPLKLDSGSMEKPRDAQDDIRLKLKGLGYL